MRKYLPVLLGLLLLAAVACQEKSTTPTPSSDSTVVNTAPPKAPTPDPVFEPTDSVSLIDVSKEILKLAAAKDYAKIAAYIHPTEGIRFSPYAYVDKEEHKHFTADEFRDLVTNKAKTKVLWGTSDPLSEPIKRTVEAYFKEFCYDKDYVNQGEYAYNETIGGSTVINNLAEAYPKAPFVEAHWSPTDEEKKPFEWGSVRLVFQEYQGNFFLIAWVHDAWST